ncbi:hypothetical protein BDZ45DRAFT_503181 [Acephala macrosclerotiorum]|nr:hypothetical protein BDZ45DRAFT_503181 [Acephala macrosclerotiorum]
MRIFDRRWRAQSIETALGSIAWQSVGGSRVVINVKGGFFCDEGDCVVWVKSSARQGCELMCTSAKCAAHSGGRVPSAPARTRGCSCRTERRSSECLRRDVRRYERLSDGERKGVVESAYQGQCAGVWQLGDWRNDGQDSDNARLNNVRGSWRRGLTIEPVGCAILNHEGKQTIGSGCLAICKAATR